MPGAEDSSGEAPKTGLLSRFEGLLKLATAGLGLVAAIGLPAVAIQLARYDVPVGTAGYQDVLRAGVLPAIVLVAIGAYCIAAGKYLTRVGWRRFLGMHSLVLVPLLIPAYLLLMVGMISLVLLYFWGLLWVLRFPIEAASGIEVSNRALLLWSVALVGIALLAMAAAKLTERFWIDRPGAFWRILRNSLARRPREGPPPQAHDQAQATPDEGPLPESAKPRSKSEPWIIALTFLPLLLVTLYSIKGVLYLWDPEYGSQLTHRYVLLASLGCGIVFALFFAGVFFADSASPGATATPGHKRALIAVAAIVYVAFALAYSMWGYPRLYPGLGGGRPEPVVLWLKHDDDARDLVMVLRATEISREGNLKRIEGAYILLNNAGDLLLTDTPLGGGKALLLNKSRLMAISW